MPDPTEKEKNVASQEVAANVESIKKHGIVTPNTKINLDAVGTVSDYWGKGNFKYKSKGGKNIEYQPISTIDQYKGSGVIKVLNKATGEATTLRGDEAKNYYQGARTQIDNTRTTDYYTTKKKISNFDNISTLLNSKDKQNIIKPK